MYSYILEIIHILYENKNLFCPLSQESLLCNSSILSIQDIICHWSSNGVLVAGVLAGSRVACDIEWHAAALVKLQPSLILPGVEFQKSDVSINIFCKYIFISSDSPTSLTYRISEARLGLVKCWQVYKVHVSFPERNTTEAYWSYSVWHVK